MRKARDSGVLIKQKTKARFLWPEARKAERRLFAESCPVGTSREGVEAFGLSCGYMFRRAGKGSDSPFEPRTRVKLDDFARR